MTNGMVLPVEIGSDGERLKRRCYQHPDNVQLRILTVDDIQLGHMVWSQTRSSTLSVRAQNEIPRAALQRLRWPVQFFRS
jgi:hypothetical protein